MNDELRSILRKGDPAAGDPGLTPEEVQEMRRTVLSAVPEPRRRGWLVPAMVTAAALILAVALILGRPEPPREAVRPPLPLAGEGRGEGSVVAKKTPPLPSPAPQEREPPAPEKKKRTRRAPEPEPVVVAQAEPPVVPEATHQIQFSTPGGTRIIWVLHPATE